ncbi:hypothetical protein VNO77_27232 [Canavalia gladiata]|uniref:Uncharacterized protein n=1 Tax=Canavalia gladiata TaxID=3824 RepID=A0AAN9KVE3_CANGL
MMPQLVLRANNEKMDVVMLVLTSMVLYYHGTHEKLQSICQAYQVHLLLNIYLILQAIEVDLEEEEDVGQWRQKWLGKGEGILDLHTFAWRRHLMRG